MLKMEVGPCGSLGALSITPSIVSIQLGCVYNVFPYLC